jgi:hypothetical protein
MQLTAGCTSQPSGRRYVSCYSVTHYVGVYAGDTPCRFCAACGLHLPASMCVHAVHRLVSLAGLRHAATCSIVELMLPRMHIAGQFSRLISNISHCQRHAAGV